MILLGDIFVTTGGALIDPLVVLWNSIVLVVPGVLKALLILIVGYIVGWAFGLLTHKFIDSLKVDKQLKKAGYAHSIGFLSVASLLGGIVKWYIVSLFLAEAADELTISTLARLLQDLAMWVPSLLAAIIIMLGGLVLADFAADRLLHAKRRGVKLVSSLVRWFIIVFVGLIALENIGIRVDLATNAVLLLVAGIAAGLAIAIGLGFGHALKPEAASIVKKAKKRL